MTNGRTSRKAVYAGTFDPPTVGHLWMIEQGAALFDELIVAIGVNPGKQPAFAVEERIAMLREATAHLPGLQITTFGAQFLIHYARAAGATHILRGIRSTADFEYERHMRNLNGDLEPGVTTVFLLPPRDLAEVSSSTEGWEAIVSRFVPAPVFERLLRRFHGSRPPGTMA